MAGHLPQDDAASVRALIAEGESHFVEFKSAWIYDAEGRRPRPLRDVAKDVAEAIVAFANADGGDLMVGVEDGGGITGAPYDEDGVRYLGQVPSQQVMGHDGLGGALVREVPIDGHLVLWFRVGQHAGPPLATSDGRCLMRRDNESRPVPPAEVERRRARILGDGGYEIELVPQARLDDLDLELLQELGQQVPHLRHFDDPERLLRYWRLVDRHNGHVIPRRAALLLFSRDPLRWHPNNRVRLRWVLDEDPGFGAGRRTREREIIGPIPKVLSQVKELLGVALERESLQEDGLFRANTLLPEAALEECLVNAIVHRNYAVLGQAIEILLYPHHVEFRSPGSIPEPLTLDDLRKARGDIHRSRNPVMMRVLRDLGWTRDQGEGIRRIFGSIRQAELHEPELEVVADTFIVRLSTRSIYDEATQSWISAYGPYGLRPEERRYVIALRRAKGTRAVDPLARDLGEAYDATKQALTGLERRAIVWHASGTRTYHLVEPLEIPFERAYRRMIELLVTVEPSTRLTRDGLEVLLSTSNQSELSEAIGRWKEQGIVAPDGRGQWKLGPGMLEYARRRGGRSSMRPS